MQGRALWVVLESLKLLLEFHAAENPDALRISRFRTQVAST